MVLGAQLYTLRDFCQNETDFNRSMERVAKIGYTTVQVSGIGPIEPKTVRKICDDHGLKIVLTHTDPNRVMNDTERVIEEHNILGCDYIGIGSMPSRYRWESWIDQFQADFKEPAQKIAKAGKLFMYHNHAFEFAAIDGKLLMDHLLEAFTPEEMGITLDTYWVQAGGGDVVQWIEKLEDRLPCVHLKDMNVVNLMANDAIFAPVGSGNMNFPGILEALEKAGSTKYLLVEQDNTFGEDPFACLQKSYDYLSGLGYK